MKCRHETLVLALVATCGACRQDMHDQARLDPYESGAMRLPPEGAVAWHAPQDEAPPRRDMALLRQGRERYDIFCAPCHGLAGNGDGPVIRRGFFRRIASLVAPRLRAATDRHLYDVITNGFDTMPDYAPEIAPRARWAIVAYVRALQAREAPP